MVQPKLPHTVRSLPGPALASAMHVSTEQHVATDGAFFPLCEHATSAPGRKQHRDSLVPHPRGGPAADQGLCTVHVTLCALLQAPSGGAGSIQITAFQSVPSGQARTPPWQLSPRSSSSGSGILGIAESMDSPTARAIQASLQGALQALQADLRASSMPFWTPEGAASSQRLRHNRCSPPIVTWLAMPGLLRARCKVRCELWLTQALLWCVVEL